jgi:hypothetical protein
VLNTHTHTHTHVLYSPSYFVHNESSPSNFRFPYDYREVQTIRLYADTVGEEMTLLTCFAKMGSADHDDEKTITLKLVRMLGGKGGQRS